MPDKISWFMRQRRKLARLLMRFQSDPPAGAFNASDHTFIDDGLDYLMPVIVPDWWPDDKKRDAVLSSMREYGFTEEQIGVLIDKRRAAIDEAIRNTQEAIEREPDAERKARLIEASAPFMDQFSAPNVWERNIPAWSTSDPLREWDSAGPLGTTSTRREILARCHLAYERNPVAKQAVHITTLFSMGDGLTLKCYNPDVEEILEAFRTNPDNAVERQEKALLDTLQIDGELFIRFYQDRNGQTLINPLKPWEIWWIETERGFPKRPISFHWYSLTTNYKPGDMQIVIEDIPADEMLHITINSLAYEQRGRPALFAALPWLKGYKDWLENRARQNFWRGSLLWWVKLIGGTPGQVSSKRGQYKQPPPPGSIVVTNDKEEWSSIENKSNASDVAEDGRQIKLMSALNFGLPEYMLADGQNSNLASASAQQLPALRTFSEYQDIAVNQIWRPIYRRVIQNAIDAGLLPDMVQVHDADGEPMFEEAENAAPLAPMAKPRQGKPKMIDTLEAFDLAAPELETDDPKTLAEALALAVTNGWASNETAAGKAGYDYALEQKKIEREEKSAQTKMYQGGAPVEGKTLPDDDQEPVQAQPTAQPAQESYHMVEADNGLFSMRLPSPVVNVTIPEQPAPIVNIGLEEVHSKLDAMREEFTNMPIVIPAPVVNVTMPEQAAAQVTVNVEPTPIEMTNEIHMPEEKPAALNVKRNSQGQITSITKE
jgi:hypothetical protein